MYHDQSRTSGSAAAGLKAGVSASGTIEPAICAIFEQMIELNGISAGDNFFDLGGDSLMAENIVAAIEMKFGVALPVSVLLEAPTPGLLAAHVARLAAGGEADKIVTIISSPGAQQVAAMVHGMSGSPLFASRFGARFRSVTRLLAIRGYGLQQGEEPMADASRIIDLYRDAAMRHAGSRDLVLGGICIGGLIACGVAQSIYQRTGRRQRLVLIDPPSIGSYWLKAGLDEEKGKQRIERLRRSAQRWRRLSHLMDAIGFGKSVVGRKARREHFKKSLTLAFAGYRPASAFPCDVLLIASSEWGKETVANYRDWFGDRASIRTEVLPGNHEGFQGVNREAIDALLYDYMTSGKSENV
jgi:thioesterase domain-containing protein/acyl carrier protein